MVRARRSGEVEDFAKTVYPKIAQTTCCMEVAAVAAEEPLAVVPLG